MKIFKIFWLFALFATLLFSSENSLRAINTNSNQIILQFSKNIEGSYIKNFEIDNPKKSNYRKVYDFSGAILNTEKFENSVNSLKAIRVSQFTKDTVRLVLEDDDKIDATYEISDNKLTITVKNSPNAVDKEPIKATVINKDNKDNKDNKVENITLNKEIDIDYKVPITAPRNANNKIIVIDAGHGGGDCGAMSSRRECEKHIVLNISNMLYHELRTRGYKVYPTRTTDKFLPLKNRTRVANDRNADIFISIHANAISDKDAKLTQKGIETYFLSPTRNARAVNAVALENKTEVEDMDYFTKNTFLNFLNHKKIVASNKLAIDIQAGMLKSVKRKYRDTLDGGVREGPFWVLIGATMPSILIEIGYLSHPEESRRLVSKQYQHLIAIGIADGIDGYFQKN